MLQHREKWCSLRVETGIPVPVDFVPVPDPTRKTSTRTRPIPAGTGRVRVYPRVRVDPHTSTKDVRSVTVVFPLWQIRIFGLFFHAKSEHPDKATGNSRSGIPGNTSLEKFPREFPGILLRSALMFSRT